MTGACHNRTYNTTFVDTQLQTKLQIARWANNTILCHCDMIGNEEEPMHLRPHVGPECRTYEG